MCVAVAVERVNERQTCQTQAQKKARTRRFDRETLTRIKRWNRTVLPILYDLGGEIVAEFRRRYGGGKSAGLARDYAWLADVPDGQFIANSGRGYVTNDDHAFFGHHRGPAGILQKGPDTLLGKPVGTGLLFNVEEWAKKFADQGRPIVAEAVRNAGAVAADEIGRGVFDPTTRTVRRELGRRVTRYSKFVVRGTDKIVQTQVRIGLRGGESIGEIAERLARRMHPKDFQVTGRFTSLHHRANTIARTETVGAHNLGNQQGMVQAGAKTRIWISMGDDRVRDSHISMDGQELEFGELWDVDGMEMEFPSDFNERCTEGPGRIGRI